MRLPKRVIIIGGTHGNEWTGITIIKHYQDEIKKKFPHLDLEFVFGNPEAYQLKKRFKDEDLNRASQFLNENRSSYENRRAKDIKKIIEKENCVVIDLHTTTSNMGKTLIISTDKTENLLLSGLIQKNAPDTKILLAQDPKKKYLISQSEFGIMIEVGPVANNVIEAEILEGTLYLLFCALRHIDDFNPNLNEIEIFEEVEDVYYPQDQKGDLSAYIHSELSQKDFTKLGQRFKAFKGFNGQEINHTTSEELYPIFINEAAYYHSKLAFSLCRKTIKKL
jgi:aspartoacylase